MIENMAHSKRHGVYGFIWTTQRIYKREVAGITSYYVFRYKLKGCPMLYNPGIFWEY